MKYFSSRFALLFASIFLTFSASAFSATKQFPNITGQTLFQLKADRVLSTKVKGVSPNNAYAYVEPRFSLNFNKNWSLKTEWQIYPSSSLTTRNATYPERTRTFLSNQRGFKPEDTGLLIEELKAQFEDEDMKFFVGKFDPSYGTAYKQNKRIGVFSTDITRDYEIREKLGGGVTALLEGAQITFNTFFNDTTGLSGSINGRSKERRSDGLAGNTGTLSSYTFSMEAEKLFGYDNWFYNLGYRSLGVDNSNDIARAREDGYLLGSEYLFKIGSNTSIIPFAEVSKISNFTGARGRNATYTTVALIGKYSSWTTSISQILRSINASSAIPKVRDHQLQVSVGYKFTDNLALDVSRADIKESNKSAVLFGTMLSYVYKY
jgi:hypothetical protein